MEEGRATTEGLTAEERRLPRPTSVSTEGVRAAAPVQGGAVLRLPIECFVDFAETVLRLPELVGRLLELLVRLLELSLKPFELGL
ncbi:hypothetical protein LV164_006909 [Aspergillus fumigatus]|nr:hypothetical protein LV157_007389 [Aspergillus fumigatus]KAJ8202827.1 hypothetical protein LV164_006909 [Aspergillus fumigatus]